MKIGRGLGTLVMIGLLVSMLSCSKSNPTSSTGGGGGGGGGGSGVVTVSITSPANNSVVNGIVAITASASSNVGGITKVDFYVDGIKIGESTSSPYTFNWDTYPKSDGGPHNLTAQAYDASNNQGNSAAVQVTIKNYITLWENTWWLNPNTYTWVTSYLLTNDSISGSTNITSGDTIDYFYVFNNLNWYRWKSGQSATAIYGWTRRASDTFRFTIPASDTIRFVWGNNGIITSKQYYAKLSYKRR